MACEGNTHLRTSTSKQLCSRNWVWIASIRNPTVNENYVPSLGGASGDERETRWDTIGWKKQGLDDDTHA
jgi:hypothetical protein